jgi:uncharacterized membrane protein
MVIGILAAMLVLGGSILSGSVQSALGVFLVFAAVSLFYMTACMVPGYIRTRTACSTVRASSRTRQPTQIVVARPGSRVALRQTSP